jgi:hypothetical protein
MGIAAVDMRQRSIAHTFGRWPMAAQSSFASSKAMRLLKTSSGASAAHRPADLPMAADKQINLRGEFAPAQMSS